MGVLYDYFQAPDRATAVNWAIGPSGDWTNCLPLDEIGADWIDAKGTDPVIVLGELVGHASSVPFGGRRDEPAVVWPDLTEWPYPRGADTDDQSPWHLGLTLQELPDSWRDTLAGIGDDAVPTVAAQWYGVEEARFADQLDAEYCARMFIALARRAQAAGTRLYCRCSV
jgi:hypothetical protein